MKKSVELIHEIKQKFGSQAAAIDLIASKQTSNPQRKHKSILSIKRQFQRWRDSTNLPTELFLEYLELLGYDLVLTNKAQMTDKTQEIEVESKQ